MKKHLVFPSLALLLLSGCVMQSTYDVKAKEADALASKSANLEANVKDLSLAKDSLLQDKDALQKEKETLQKEIETLQKEKDAALKEKEALAAKIAELSQKAAAIFKADEKEIMTVTPVDSPPPHEAGIRGSVRCALCGEKLMESRGRVRNGTIVCIPCFERA